MTNQNNDDVLEIVEKHGGSVVNGGRMVIFGRDGSFHSFVAGLREKDAKLIAGMVEESKRLRKAISDMCLLSDNGELLLVAHNALINTDALSAAKSTAEAFMAEHDARVLEETSSWYEMYHGFDKHGVSDLLRRMAAEKRKSAKQEGEGK